MASVVDCGAITYTSAPIAIRGRCHNVLGSRDTGEPPSPTGTSSSPAPLDGSSRVAVAVSALNTQIAPDPGSTPMAAGCTSTDHAPTDMSEGSMEITSCPGVL